MTVHDRTEQVDPEVPDAALIEQVDAALAEGRFDDAMALVESAGPSADTKEFLPRLAQAAYGAGRFEDSVAAWERLHALCCESGDRSGAARAAAMVAMFLMIDTGLMAPVRGWLQRAGDLLEELGDDPTAAVICAVRTYERFMCGAFDEALEQATRAIELGRLHGDRAAEVIGRTASARVAILSGDVDSGVAQLDEVGAQLMSGEVDRLTTGMMLCEIVCAAQGLARHDMAAEWTDAMSRWGSGAAFGGLGGRCRVHRAEILRVSGPADAAEDEALRACDDLRPWMRREFGWPLAELGNVRLRRGDLDGAEEAYLAAHQHVWCPHPGLAMVKLARGEPAAARELIDEAISNPFRTPSKERPPFVDLTLAPLYEASVEIHVAMADEPAARESCESLRAIADKWGGPWLTASADLAEARTALLGGDHHRATGLASSAAGAWAGQGAPYEAARARTVLAEAQLAAGKPASAELERRAALAALDEYGAVREARELRSLLESAAGSGTGGYDDRPGGEAAAPAAGAPRPKAEFSLSGDMRTVSFDGETSTLGDLKGFRYLARMLAEPEREFHVLDLVAVEQGTLPTAGEVYVGAAEVDGPAGEGLPALDDRAREEYRRRLAEVEADIEDAASCNDPARLELAESDRSYLVAELARAVGLGGRMRKVGGNAERARTAVARALRYATDRLDEHIPSLAVHLRNSIHTGMYCSYRPDSLSSVEWKL